MQPSTVQHRGRAHACMWGRWYRVGEAGSCDSMSLPSAAAPSSLTSLNLLGRI